MNGNLKINGRPIAGGALRLVLEGTLDHGGAHHLAQHLGALQDRALVIDFSQLREVSDLALGLVARPLRAHPQLRVTGLRDHGRRILRAFGVSLLDTGAVRDAA
ncbi:STAS domain-containing protein [Vulgatibacter sp.]|uniref:STAS domain-containing protein n=1 Tax=Vulgatibacter sp. TaxID=1971226 RepID=UPI003564DBBC